MEDYPADDVLKANKQRLIKELKKRIHQYENRYELKSENLDEELSAGRIKDTAEVCDWVIAFHTYGILQNGRQAQME